MERQLHIADDDDDVSRCNSLLSTKTKTRIVHYIAAHYIWKYSQDTGNFHDSASAPFPWNINRAESNTSA